MEPIERELHDRKERLKEMALELQRLEAIRPRRPLPRAPDEFDAWDEHDKKILDLGCAIDSAKHGIRDLEEIIAEGRNPVRRPKPDVSRRRKLSDEERTRIAAEERARLMADGPLHDDFELHVTVERFTSLDGVPQVQVFSRMKPDRIPKPSRDS